MTLEQLLDTVESTMRAESDRLASPGTRAAVEQGIGVARAMTTVKDAIRRIYQDGRPHD